MIKSNLLEEKLIELRSLETNTVQHFQYSNIAKLPFKVHSFIEIMNCRMIDFCDSANILITNNHIVPSLALIRSLFENIAIIYRIKLSVDKSLNLNMLADDFDDLLTKIIFGTRYGSEIEAINILTHLEKLDKDYNGIRKFYDELCEFVHPNCDGVQSSYSVIYENERKTEILKVLTYEHPLYLWIEDCFIMCMEIYLNISTDIKNNLTNFSFLCEAEIVSRK